MLYRLLMWFQSFFARKFLCQICGSMSDDYTNSGVIKVKYANGAVMDLLTCKECLQKLEGSKMKR